MPSGKALARARKDKHEGKSASTQAGEFVREEIEHMGEGEHAPRSVKQAIAIGLSEARHAGVDVPAKKAAANKKITRKKPVAKKAVAKKTTTRGGASINALKREGRAAASVEQAVPTKGSAGRKVAAKKASRAKGATGRSAGATRAARTRAMRARER